MKKFSLILFAMVCTMLTKLVAQESIQFSFIGKVGGKYESLFAERHESIVITTGENWRKSDTEMVPMDRRAFDTLKSCLLHKYAESKRSSNPQNNIESDSLKSSADIKVTGIDSEPWYFSKGAFSELVRSCSRHFDIVGLMTPNVRGAFLHLRWLGDEYFLHRHEKDPVFIDTSINYLAIPNDHVVSTPIRQTV